MRAALVVLAACAHAPAPAPPAMSNVAEPPRAPASTAADREITGCDPPRLVSVLLRGTVTDVGLEVCHPDADSRLARIVAGTDHHVIDRWRDTSTKKTTYHLATILLTPDENGVLIVEHDTQEGAHMTVELLAYTPQPDGWTVQPIARGSRLADLQIGPRNRSIVVIIEDSAGTSRTIDVSHDGTRLVVAPHP